VDTGQRSATLAVAAVAGLAQLTLLYRLAGPPRPTAPDARAAADEPSWLARLASILGMVVGVIAVTREFEGLVLLVTR
jgi:hypothetical protein